MTAPAPGTAPARGPYWGGRPGPSLLLHLCAIGAAISAVIFFILYANNVASNASDLGWGLLCVAASIGLWELEGVLVVP
jgi:hypothetical protein